MTVYSTTNGKTMTNEIAVSIWCLTYNHERYIRDALEGFIMQECSFNYEVIVHDDCSTDGTPEIIKEYANQYPNIIKPIFEEKNLWSTDRDEIIHKMIQSSKGRYIATCEGDDFWIKKDKLQIQYNMIENNQECSISTHKVKGCNLEKMPMEACFPSEKYGIRGTQVMEDEDAVRAIIVGGYPFHTSSYFFKMDILYVEINNSYDVGMLRRALICGKIHYFDEIMSMRRMDVPGSFNDRLKRGGLNESLKAERLLLNTDMEFDRLTNGRYHLYVLKKRWKRLVEIACWTKDINVWKEWLEEFDFDLERDRMDTLHGENIKQHLIYYCFMLSPNIAVKFLNYIRGKNTK